MMTLRVPFSLLTFFLLAGAAWLLVACGPSEKPLWIPTPMPSGASYTGAWYSEDFGGRVLLTQEGNKVSGKYNAKTGEMIGEIDGVLEGAVLIFDWVQRGDSTAGERDVKGKGYIIISPDNKSFAGEWGLNMRRSGGKNNKKPSEGKWKATRQSNIPE